MPEGPEVALTAHILDSKLSGLSLINIQFISGRYTKKIPEGLTEFKKALPARIKKIDSMGKFMWIEIKTKNDIWYIWNTFGLTGGWTFEEVGNIRAELEFSHGITVYFFDLRNFGTFKFSQDSGALSKKIEELSPDFLKCNTFSLTPMKKYNIPIVKLLMNQKKIGSGLGNYLTAEILYSAKLSPHRTGSSLTTGELKSLKYWIKYMVKLAYEHNNTSYVKTIIDNIDSIEQNTYHDDIDLKDSKFGFRVYRKKTDPYGNKVVADKIIDGRTFYWVPSVQK